MMDAPTPDPLRPRSLVGSWRIEGYAIGSLLLVTGCFWWMGHGPHAQIRVAPQTEVLSEDWAKADEPASLADASVPASVSAQVSSAAPAVIGVQVPDEPMDGQMRAPCRRRGTLTINGGCWIPWLNLSPPCGEDAYEWKGACYLPLWESGRAPTSEQPH
jgi:eukaryotic-like serine/threonine-protein kinase